jgi:glycosyltransferase involved in cell wall biosynthesis
MNFKGCEGKILFIIPSLQLGGMERVMSQLLDYNISNWDIEIHLILYGIKRDVFYKIPNNVVIHRPSFEFNKNYRLVSSLKTLVFLRTKVKELKPMTILSFGELWNNFVLLSLFGLQFPIYVSDRCQPNKSLGKTHDLLRKWLYPNARGIIAQTRLAKEIYKTQLKHRNIKVIGNPIRSITWSQPVQREKVVLSVGRLINTKHHERLIRLFSDIESGDWKLIIVGGNAQKQQNEEKLQLLIKELKLEGKVILTGNISDVESYYLISKIFAFTSSSEGFPNVIGEALSAGLPVVSYDCIAGPADMVVNGVNGYLVNVFDDEGFKQRLSDLMQNEKLRLEMSEKAVLSIEKFDTSRITQQYFEFITKHLS